MKSLAVLKKSIYVTRPLFPEFNVYSRRLKTVWKSKWLTNNGSQHNELESELKKLLKVPNFLVFNNGTIALLVALRALKLVGEVITTPFTFPATTNVLLWNNLTPVFCDINYDSMNIDVNKIEKLITEKTSAILAVHVFGNPSNVVAIDRIANKYKLKVIYDAAHAFQTEINGIGIGNYGDATMYSFHATKLFNTAEGGGLATKNLEDYKTVKLLRNFGITGEEEVVEPGINGKLNEIQAAFGLSVIPKIKGEREKRKLIRDSYYSCLSKVRGLVLPQIRNDVTKDSYQYFAIKIDKKMFGRSRDEVYFELRKKNVFARKYFYPLVSNYPYFKDMPSASPSKLPVAKKVSEEVLCLPFYGGLCLKDSQRICQIIASLKC